jgi:hypothetical protein
MVHISSLRQNTDLDLGMDYTGVHRRVEPRAAAQNSVAVTVCAATVAVGPAYPITDVGSTVANKQGVPPICVVSTTGTRTARRHHGARRHPGVPSRDVVYGFPLIGGLS